MTLPVELRELPRRIAECNDAGPRYQQSVIAEKSGLSKAALSRLAFYKQLGGLRVVTLCRIAATLNVSVSTLLGDAPLARPAPQARKKIAGKPTPKPARKKKRARTR